MSDIFLFIKDILFIHNEKLGFIIIFRSSSFLYLRTFDFLQLQVQLSSIVSPAQIDLKYLLIYLENEKKYSFYLFRFATLPLEHLQIGFPETSLPVSLTQTILFRPFPILRPVRWRLDPFGHVQVLKFIEPS